MGVVCVFLLPFYAIARRIGVSDSSLDCGQAKHLVSECGVHPTHKVERERKMHFEK
jgi:Cft2 family RNA processing exonuclease